MQKEDVIYSIDNGILFANFRKGLEINLENAKSMVQMRIDLQKDKLYPVLIYSNGFKIKSHEAREYMKKEGTRGMTAGAFLIKNPLEKMIANFFIAIKPPKVPAKLFTNANDAIKWLSQYKQK